MPEISTPAAPAPAREPGRGLEMHHATLRHPGASQPVLDDVTLRVRPGEHTAIVGSTGAGKTTLLQALSRQLRLTDGQVLLDGTDLEQTELREVRRRVALVPQRAHLFSGTVASNLRYGAPDASDADLWSALRAAQADDVVASAPDGLDAAVAAGGTNFSGGQRQRLCIARALLARPEHYLFDDTSAALDAHTDAALRQTLAEWTAQAGMVTVSQRLSSVVSADHIVVLDRGAVVGQGTHEELLAGCTTYQELVESQGEDAYALEAPR